jgi:hypothetical protein
MSNEYGTRPAEERPVWIRQLVYSWWAAIPLGFGASIGLTVWGSRGGPSLGTVVFVPALLAGFYLCATFVTIVVFKPRSQQRNEA